MELLKGIGKAISIIMVTFVYVLGWVGLVCISKEQNPTEKEKRFAHIFKLVHKIILAILFIGFLIWSWM